MNLSRLLYGVLAGLLIQSCDAEVVPFEVTLTWQLAAPDGVERKMVLINGRTSAPQLRLSYGDQVEFKVHNSLPFNTSVHFHGIEQLGSPEYDGVPGLTQSPIEPGETYLYKWTALQYGTYWYHGHVQGLVSDGLYGAIHIQPPSDEPLPFDQISSNAADLAAIKRAAKNPHIALISDWVGLTSAEYYAAEQASGLDIYCVHSILTNGKGAVNCQPQSLLNEQLNPNLGKLLQSANLSLSDRGCTPMSPVALSEGNFATDPSKIPAGLESGCQPTEGSQEVFQVSADDGWVSINIVSAASAKAVTVSIDEHPMWVYAADGNFVEPQLVDTLFMYNGERYSVLVKLDKTPGNYTIRIANNLPDQLLSGYATLSYAQGTYTDSTATINYAGVPLAPNSTRALNASTLRPLPGSGGGGASLPPSAGATAETTTHVLDLGRLGANWRWSSTNVSSYPNDTESGQQPPLLYLSDPAAYAAAHPDTAIATLNGSWVDLVAVAGIWAANPAQPPHPMHKHGNKGWVVGSGTGDFVWESVAQAAAEVPGSFNFVDPPYRDGFATPAVLGQPAWTAFRYQVTNPGAWLLHCHIQTHLVGGMAIAILDGVDAWPTVGDGGGDDGGY